MRMPSLECFSGQVQLGEGLVVDPELGGGIKYPIYIPAGKSYSGEICREHFVPAATTTQSQISGRKWMNRWICGSPYVSRLV